MLGKVLILSVMGPATSSVLWFSSAVAQLPTQFLANAPKKAAEDGPSVWLSASMWET